ncbi:glycosyl hydrolase family 8 [Anaeromyxobacter sp. Fw109-5]|uniref:glycosyl hydrolase family 8 n=1 Tax=Anaeromyxobacter sp. (strain Fw109-5) TaxID=404589 RepID=UPI000158A61C|nr:glycosyl hydrolase family 8 [Anaeromyxobacter sp. Fw109-5]ABS25981.1 glycosyl transferase family 2 [Anaeromyxobacter sp. Fw109-5]
MRVSTWLLLPISVLLACGHGERSAARDARARAHDELSALWSFYRYSHVDRGRVVAHDEAGITTSEGQSYALLRAVWAGDRATFDEVWRWTRENLQVRDDELLAWKWKDRVLDRNAATDADQDTALALVLASRRFGEARYLEEARRILADVWEREVIQAGGRFLPTGGNWAPRERYPTIHVAYLAPYAYEVFAGVDPAHPWKELVRGSYEILRFLYFDRGVVLPPERIWVDSRSGALLLDKPGGGPAQTFGYDSVPLFWRVALDAAWFGRRGEADLRARMLAFPRETFRAEGRIRDRYTTGGRALSELDGQPHMASIAALAAVEDRGLASDLRSGRLDALFERALAGEATPYYLHNWLWLGRALELGVARRYDEPLAFLLGIDWGPFRERFPLVPVLAALALAPLARRFTWARAGLLGLAIALSARYLGWRARETLNFVEPLGPVISLSLLAAEAYAFSTVLLLAVQVGVSRRRREPPAPLAPDEEVPSVDVFVPIYSESLEILDKTLAACMAMRHPRKTVHVCDDSHREAVARLAAEHGARYVPGPKRHAKAGNLNNALSLTSGDLVVVFDTDHVPCAAFLERTVPHFREPRMGVVQTPHHFYNPDVFQRALGTGPAVPNEADLFNHAIQAGRDRWGGAFFVGSGAVFRRAAIASVGGFNLLSITEDIHTSQKLHAKGWRSAFVDEDLAVGLSAENVQSYLVQRRRWMLGCLQIFFKDNPLLERGLPLRHRVGYFASLWYFFFPLARVAFFLTPLWYLLFHLHPLFADLPVLLAYLAPHLLLSTLAANALLPGWPRLLWGTVYEAAVAFPLARATLDLLLPKSLGFKVTPKGIVSDRRRFDASSSRLTLAAAALAGVALAKGAFELVAFGIEVEAYAFNLFWAGSNLAAVLAALLVAWERPQRREDERVRRRVPVRVEAPALSLCAETVDLSTTGAGLRLPASAALPPAVEVAFSAPEPLRVRARVVWREEVRGATRAGLAFEGLPAEARRALVRIAFSSEEAFSGAHDARTRSQLAMALQLLAGIARAFLPLHARRRLAPRRPSLRPLAWVGARGRVRGLVVDSSSGGFGALFLGRAPREDLPVLLADGIRWARVAHARRVVPGVWRAGLAYLPVPLPERPAHEYLAA